MPTIEVSEEQRAYVQALREKLADQVTYGHVRTQDALQYLIDHHREDATPEVEIEEAIEPDGGVTGAEFDEGGSAGGTTTAVEAGGGAGSLDPSDGGSTGADGDPDPADHGGSDADTPPGDDGGSDAGGSGPETDRTEGGDQPLPGGDSSMVNEMMNLVDQHDDKWSETDAAGGRYEVDLPDGDTEVVQTKDDVRAILFKHYR